MDKVSGILEAWELPQNPSAVIGKTFCLTYMLKKQYEGKQYPNPQVLCGTVTGMFLDGVNLRFFVSVKQARDRRGILKDIHHIFQTSGHGWIICLNEEGTDYILNAEFSLL